MLRFRHIFTDCVSWNVSWLYKIEDLRLILLQFDGTNFTSTSSHAVLGVIKYVKNILRYLEDAQGTVWENNLKVSDQV